MKIRQLLVLLLLFFLGACHSLERYDWVGPSILKGTGGVMKKENGVEVWVQGEPDREYVPIKVIETMTTGTVGVQSYLFGVLKKQTAALKGDGFILLSNDAKPGGTYTAGSSTTNVYGSVYGNNVTGQAITTGTAISVPIQYNTYRALVFRYKEALPR